MYADVMNMYNYTVRLLDESIRSSERHMTAPEISYSSAPDRANGHLTIPIGPTSADHPTSTLLTAEQSGSI